VYLETVLELCHAKECCCRW